MKKNQFADLMIGLLLVVLGIAVLILSGGLAQAKVGLGPAGYPRAVAVIMLVLGLIMVISKLAQGLPKLDWKPDKQATIRVVGTVVISFIYLWLLSHIGFLFLTPFYLFTLMWIFGYQNLKVAALASIGSAVVIYLLFTKAFMVFLPEFSLF